MASQKGCPPPGHGLTPASLAGPALQGRPWAPSSSPGLDWPCTCAGGFGAEAPVGADPPCQPEVLKCPPLGGGCCCSATGQASTSALRGTVAASGDTSGGRAGDAAQHPGGTGPGPGHLA